MKTSQEARILDHLSMGQTCIDCNKVIKSHGKNTKRCSFCNYKNRSILMKGKTVRRPGYRHSQETKDKIKNAHIGLKHTLESRKKISISHKNSTKSKIHLESLHAMFKGRSPWNKGKKTGNCGNGFKKGHKSSNKWLIAMRKAMSGKNNPSWKGGITSLHSIIRNSQENKDWKNKIFVRDNYICQECLTRGKRIQAHHIKQFSVILKEFLNEYNQFSIMEDRETLIRLAINYKPFWNLDNGRTLCKDCHSEIKIYVEPRKTNF